MQQAKSKENTKEGVTKLQRQYIGPSPVLSGGMIIKHKVSWQPMTGHRGWGLSNFNIQTGQFWEMDKCPERLTIATAEGSCNSIKETTKTSLTLVTRYNREWVNDRHKVVSPCMTTLFISLDYIFQKIGEMSDCYKDWNMKSNPPKEVDSISDNKCKGTVKKDGICLWVL